MNWKLLAISIGTMISCACHAAEPIQKTIDHLMTICLAHPDFEASSIDFYDPKKSQSWEIYFYETAKGLHQRGGEPTEVLLRMRKNAKPAQVRCIDGILNTWLG